MRNERRAFKALTKSRDCNDEFGKKLCRGACAKRLWISLGTLQFVRFVLPQASD